MFKYLLTAFIAIIFCVNAFSQKVYFSTSINTNIVYSIKKTTDKGYMIFSLISYLGHFANHDNILTKLDRKGNVQWQKILNVGNILSDNVFLTNNGNFIIHGMLLNFYIQQDILLGIDQSGDKLWQTKPDSNERDQANYNNVCIEDNGIINMITSDPWTYNIFIEKIDSNGSRISKTLIPNFKAFIVHNLIKTSSNSYVFNSYDTSFWGSGPTCIDSTGNILWNRDFFKVPAFYTLMFIGNTIYALISVQDSVTLLHGLSCYQFDTNGNLINKRQLIPPGYWFGGSNPILFDGLSISKSLKDGFYFFVNYYDSTGRHFTNSQLFKIDENLNTKWNLTFSKPIQCIDTGNCNSIICAFANENNESIIESIAEPDLEDVCDKCDHTLFPNPTTDAFFNIRSNYPDVFIESIELYDYAGKSVWNNSSSIDSNFFTLNNNLNAGVYICRIGCDNGKEQVKKIMISK